MRARQEVGAASGSPEHRIDNAPSFKITAMRGARRRRSSAQLQRLPPSAVKRSPKRIHHVSQNCPVHGKKAKAAVAATARTKRTPPSLSSHSTPCMFTRIMNFIVAKTCFNDLAEVGRVCGLRRADKTVTTSKDGDWVHHPSPQTDCTSGSVGIEGEMLQKAITASPTFAILEVETTL
ncbi:hypothetical protein EmuJ_000364800 [Echinococcus multilocularis]|uniref:Uncharacterized protein n=1 Tax=Echinococcus multilocularis TaxID=6211 RepID=A0A068Y0C3_ECHMU|nr:hypothetical protein EmuJ_000364800 [Echinococcus multilocularis]